jgi:asparagine synthase (glutamine-hydrolysing)
VCGIAGYVGTDEIPQERLSACLSRMRRRGPDRSDVWSAAIGSSRRVYLLNSRLRILDLDDRSDQPFHAGPLSITYNGELYNYRELARDFVAAGGAMTTTSDTEVLLRSIESIGWHALDRFEGMWAFAVHDSRDGTVTLCRDRFGEKPLYVLRDENGLYFASEVKFIVALSGRIPPPDMEQLRRYLVNGFRSLYKTPATFFEGIRELSPGTRLQIDAAGEETLHRYWTFASGEASEMSAEEAVEGVRERLIRAVSLRLRADVPIAFCLSGGVDSNAIAAIASRRCGADVHAFTVVDSDPRYDESALVREAVRDLGIKSTEVSLDKGDFLESLRHLVDYHDAPIYTISYYVHWKLMERIASSGYRVSMSGTGADELFSGYYDHHLAYLFDVRDTPLHPASVEAWQRVVRGHVRNPYLSDPDLFLKDPAFREHLYLNADDFARYLHLPLSEPFVEQRFAPGLLRNRMLNELFVEVVPVILHEDDLNGMYYSVENRSPYLDRDLFEFSLRIPTQHLVRNGYAKSVLREAVRGIAPAAVLDAGRKVGFNASIHSLLDTQNPLIRRQLLSDSPVFTVVKRDRITSLLDRRELRDSESKFLFNFVNAKLFLERHAA